MKTTGDTNCSCREILPREDAEKLLSSSKKTCTQKKLLKTLSAIHVLGITYEGKGGELGYYGSGEPGTGLRAPGMPLYNMPASHRHCILKFLRDRRLITTDSDDPDEWTKLQATETGRRVLAAFPEYGWYLIHTYNPTGPTSGYTHKNLVFLDVESYQKRVEQCKGYQGIGQSTHMSISPLKVGQKGEIL